MGEHKKKIVFVFLLLFLSSCSPIARHSRLVKKYPFVHINDTVVVKDTIKISIPKVKIDSVMQLDTFIIRLNDTLVLEKERLKVEIYKIKDSVYLNGTCDTVYIDKIIEKKVPIRYYEKENLFNAKKYGLIFISALFLLLILIVVVKLLQILKK